MLTEFHILSLSDSLINLQQIPISIFHHTLNMSLHYLVKYLCLKNRNTQEVIEANCHVRLNHLKNFYNICLVKYLLDNSQTKICVHQPCKTPIIDCIHLL